MSKKSKMSMVIILILFVGLIILYNFAASQYCIKKIILPIVAEKTNSQISVDKVEFSPMNSSLMISDLAYISPRLSMHSEKLIIKTSIYDLLFARKINIKKMLLQNASVNLDISPIAEVKNIGDVRGVKKKVNKTAVKIAVKKEKAFSKFSLNNIRLENLDIVVKNRNTITNIKNFNLNIPKIEPEKECVINLDGNISATDGKKRVDGFIKSKSIIVVNDEFMPVSINSASLINLDGNKMPFTVSLVTDKDGFYKFSSKVSDIIIEPFVSAFVTGAYSKTKGKIKNIDIEASGKNINDLMTGTNPVKSSVEISGINISCKNKFSFNNKSIKSSFDLSSILNKKYYINSLKVDESSIVIVKKTKTAPISSSRIQTKTHSASPTAKTVSIQKESTLTHTASPTAKTVSIQKEPTLKNYDFDIKNISINNLRAEFLSDKKLVFSNVDISAKEIKADTPGTVSVNLNYAIDNKLKGTLKTRNDITITSNLVPETLNSQIVLLYGKNKSTSNIKFTCEQISKKTIPFSLNADVENLLLDPFLKVFVPSPYNTTKTNVSNLKISLKGENLYDIKTSDGTINSDFNNISLPINVKNENIIEVMFFPLRVVSGLASNTALRFISGDVANAIMKIDNMFNNNKRIDFKNGKLDIGLESGVIHINNFNFFGVAQSPVKQIKASGTINLNNKALDLNTSTILAGLKIPIVVGGTIQKPQTDITKLIAQVLQDNAGTISKTGMDITNTVNDTIDKIKNKNFDELLSPTTDNTQKEKYNPLDKLLNDVKLDKKSKSSLDDLLKNLGNSTNKSNAAKTESTSKQNNINNTINDVLDILGKNTNNSSDDQSQTSESDKTKKKSISIDNAVKNLLNF